MCVCVCAETRDVLFGGLGCGTGRWLLYRGLPRLPEATFYWELPRPFLGNQVIPPSQMGNDITLVAYLSELRPHEHKGFEVVFREQFWKRPDGQPATREHLLMALADLDEVLIRATHSTDMLSAGITGVSMETAVPSY
ncbi:hypothetical protein L345_17552, partial [Ophiophagus hannah]